MEGANGLFGLIFRKPNDVRFGSKSEVRVNPAARPLHPWKRTCRRLHLTSASGQKATWSLFDHLVSADKQRWQDGEAERSRGSEVYHKLKFRGLLDG